MFRSCSWLHHPVATPEKVPRVYTLYFELEPSPTPTPLALSRTGSARGVTFAIMRAASSGKGGAYLLGLLAKIKCSICSYQLNF